MEDCSWTHFEHEADIASVQVLGAEPCSRALLTVSRATFPVAPSLRSPHH